MKKIMIVQPFGYVTDEEYDRVKNNAIETLECRGYTIVNETKNMEWYTNDNMTDLGIRNPNICKLAKSLEVLSLVHAVYFCYNWDRTDHGMYIHEMARKFNVKRIYEGGE